MNQDYLFKEIRKGVTAARQVVAVGYCTAEFMDDKKLEAVIIRNGAQTTLPCTFELVQAPAFAQHKNKDKMYSRVLTICTQIPLKIYAKDRFEIRAVDDRAAQFVLCSSKGKNIIKALQDINCSLDMAKEEAGAFVIRGWAIDFEDVTLKLKDRETGEILPLPEHTPEWYIRSDAMRCFSECDQPEKIGFSMKLPLDWMDKKLELLFQAGKCEHKETIRTSAEQIGGRCINALHVNFLRVYNNTKTFGVKNTCAKIKRHLKFGSPFSHKDYNKWARRKLLTPKEMEEQKERKFAYNPKFSILVPLYESNEKYLKELIASVQAQTYANWELCFSDGSRDHTRLERIIREYADADSRIRWIAQKKGPLGISENTNQAYEIATGDFIVLGDHDDLFTVDALYECVKALNKERVQVIYTDEDKIDENGKRYFAPNFKPDFNIDLLRCNNYICHMFVAAKALVEKVGLFDPAYNGAQDYDFIFRCIEQADGIHHIPRVLYHWRAHTVSTAEIPESKIYAFEAGKRAILAHLKRVGLDGIVEDGDNLGFYKVSYPVKGNPLLSIVIPNKDHIDDLKKCMKAIDDRSTYRNYEYIIVENNSEKEETFAYYKEIETRDNVTVLYWPEEFNYSRINNFGVEHAKGDYILLLNNDTEMINDDCLEQMLGYCQREEVGIVGARLYYDDNTIQHAGVIVGFGGIAGHAFVTLNEDEGLYQSRTKVACDYSAVTAACMMVKKAVFEEVGGLEPEFKVAFNDVDFCMKVRQTGKLVVYVPQATLYHYESKSRGLEDTPEKQNRFSREVALFAKRWPEILADGDPYYNVNLALDAADFSIRV